MTRLQGTAGEQEFVQEVIRRSGQKLLDCLQCGKCSGSCPICSDTVGGPRRLVATILYGLKQQALTDPTWWYCVSCGTCMTRCPVEINMYEVATTLCEMAAEEGIKPQEPEIHLFDELFLQSVAQHGRAKEVQVVMHYNLRTLQPLKDWRQGLALLRKGAISPREMWAKGPQPERLTRLWARVRAVAKEE